MKITDVKIYPLQTPLTQPFAFSQGWVNKRSATIVEIVTDSGVTGWGEAFNQGLEPPQISAAAIEYALKPLILGADPLDTEVLWHRMYHQTRDYGRKGAVIAAISAVDIALWDIAGKYYGVPIAKLLGGLFRNKVAAYATGFYRISGQGEATRLGEEAISHYEAGFRAMKVKLGYGLEDDLAVMREVKRALGTRDVTLMVDTNHGYGLSDALRLGKGLEEYNLRWYEEPVAPEDYAGYRALCEKLNMPIAGGENEHTLFGFRELIGRGCVDVAQPDIGSAGGFSGMPAHRRLGPKPRRASQSSCLGFGRGASGVATAHRRAAHYPPRSISNGTYFRIRHLVTSVPPRSDFPSGYPAQWRGRYTLGARIGNRSEPRSVDAIPDIAIAECQ